MYINVIYISVYVYIKYRSRYYDKSTSIITLSTVLRAFLFPTRRSFKSMYQALSGV